MHRLIIISIFLLPLGFFPGKADAQDTTGDTTGQEYINGHTAYIKGMEAFENKEYKAAVKLLSAAYIHLPDNAGTKYALSDAYLHLGDLSNASYYGQQAVTQEPSNKWYRLKLAKIYEETGNIRGTINQFKAILTLHPHDTQVQFELARALAYQGDFLASNDIYNQLLQNTGEAIPIHLQKLNNFKELGLQDSAITQLQKIRELDPDNLSTFRALSTYYLQMGMTKEAKSILQKALAKDVQNSQTLIKLADIYANEAKWDSVQATLSSVISDHIVQPEAKLVIAQYLISQYEQNSLNREVIEMVSSLLKEFIEQQPGYAKAQSLAAKFFIDTQQHEKALQALEKTNQLLPSDDKAWRQRLQLLMEDKKYNTIIKIGAEAEKNIPQDPFVLYFLGSAYLATNQPGPAIDRLKEASTLPARRNFKALIFSTLGEAYAKTKNEQQSLHAYEQAAKTDPENAGALNGYAYQLALEGQQLDKAEELAMKALDLSGEQNRAPFFNTIGWVFFKKKNYPEAEKYMKAAVEVGDPNAEVLEHLGDVYDKLGKSQLAKKWWQKALDKDQSRTHLKNKISQ